MHDIRFLISRVYTPWEDLENIRFNFHPAAAPQTVLNRIRARFHLWVPNSPVLGEEKGAKIIQAIEESYDKNHLHRPVYITLKTAQRAFGKLNALAACWRTEKPWLLFITKDISRYVIANPDANTTPKQY